MPRVVFPSNRTCLALFVSFYQLNDGVGITSAYQLSSIGIFSYVITFTLTLS